MSKHHDHTIKGTPIKLRSGDWGVRVKDQGRGLEVGDTISTIVNAKSGKNWTQTSKVVWTDGGATVLLAKSSSTRKSSSNGSSKRRSNYVSCQDSEDTGWACSKHDQRNCHGFWN